MGVRRDGNKDGNKEWRAMPRVCGMVEGWPPLAVEVDVDVDVEDEEEMKGGT